MRVAEKNPWRQLREYRRFLSLDGYISVCHCRSKQPSGWLCDITLKGIVRTRYKYAAVVIGIIVLIIILGLALYIVIAPTDDVTERKDFVQTYVVTVGGLAAFGTLLVGWRNLRLAQKAMAQNRSIEEGRAQDAALQAYLERIGELLLDRNLRATEGQTTDEPPIGETEKAEKERREREKASEEDRRLSTDAKALATIQTQTVLRRLDGTRKGYVLRFLNGLGLIQKNSEGALTIHYADLHGADLVDADLINANLEGADLRGADLSRVKVFSASLRRANLREANLRNCPKRGSEAIAR